MSAPHDVFTMVPMSTTLVLAQTREVVAASGLTLRLLETDFDVDEPEDLPRLAARLAQDSALRQGHTARAGLGSYDGMQPRGFELALRSSQWAALDWWISRVPELANRVPPVQGNQLPWVPLARVLTPNFLSHPTSQTEMVEFLLARGANPWQKLPYDAGSSVVQYARVLKSPQLVLLELQVVPTLVAATAASPSR